MLKREGKVEDRILVELGSVAMVVGIDLGLCPPSLGAGCAKAVIVAAGGGLGASATTELPPVAAIFGGCTLASLTLFGTSLDEFFDISNSIRAYERRTEEDRLAIEGIFREIESDPDL